MASAKRIVLNRKWFAEADLAAADALFGLASKIVFGAVVPDEAPLGLGLIEGGGVVAFVGDVRVAEATTGAGGTVKKPRAAKLSSHITIIGGYGFPGRFLETGTVKMAAEPFLTPSLMDFLPEAEGFIHAAFVKRGLVSALRKGAGDVYGSNITPPVRAELKAVIGAIGI